MANVDREPSNLLGRLNQINLEGRSVINDTKE